MKSSHYVSMKWWLLSIVCSSLFLSNCGSDAPVLFVMNVQADFEIPAGLNNLDSHYFILRDVPTLARNYVSPENEDQIEEIVGQQGTISAQFDPIDWGIVQEVVVTVYEPFDEGTRKEAFHQDVINFNGVDRIELFGSLPNVKDILLNDRVTIEVRIRFRNVTPRTVAARLNLNFQAHGRE